MTDQPHIRILVEANGFEQWEAGTVTLPPGGASDEAVNSRLIAAKFREIADQLAPARPPVADNDQAAAREMKRKLAWFLSDPRKSPVLDDKVQVAGEIVAKFLEDGWRKTEGV